MNALRDILEHILASENAEMVHHIDPPTDWELIASRFFNVGFEVVFGGVCSSTIGVSVRLFVHAPHAADPEYPHHVRVLVGKCFPFPADDASGQRRCIKDGFYATEAEAMAAIPILVRDVVRQVFVDWNIQAWLDADWDVQAHGLK